MIFNIDNVYQNTNTESRRGKGERNKRIGEIENKYKQTSGEGRELEEYI